MKRRILAFILCLVCVFAFAACGKKSKDQPDNPEPEQPGNQVTEPPAGANTLLNGFENLVDYYSFGVSNRFGAIKRNTDKAYITEGEASLKVDAYGDYTSGGEQPCIGISLSSDGENVNVSKLKSITVDIFNAAQENSQVKLSLTVDGTSVGDTEFTLKPGKNEVKLTPPMQYLSILSDMTKGEKINISFPRAVRGQEGGHVFYIDNLRMFTHILPYEQVELQLDENEFCSFDKPVQGYVTTTQPVGPSADCLPILSINANPMYIKGDTGRSLKATLPSGTAPIGDGWPAITFIPTLCEKMDWSALMKQNKYLVFDVYNTGLAQNFTVEMWGGVTHTEHVAGKVAGKTYQFTAKQGEWVTVRCPLSEMDDGYNEVTKPLKLSENLKTLNIVYAKFDGAPKDVYFDNFRFER